MNDSSSQFDRLSDLTQAICDNRASEDDFAELDAILLADQAARRYFLDSCQLRAALRFELRANRAVQNVQRQITTGSSIPPVSAYGDATEESPSGRQISVSPPPVYGTFGYLSSGWPMAYLLATRNCGAWNFDCRRCSRVSALERGPFGVGARPNAQRLPPKPTSSAGLPASSIVSGQDPAIRDT